MDFPSSFETPDDVVWDSALYRSVCSFVPENGKELVELLHPREGERILDLGCGTGQLTRLIAQSGADVTGIDPSRSMIEAARDEYPDLDFYEEDAFDHDPATPYDAVFSNAVLHWIEDHSSLLERVRELIVPGGRFAAEMGAKGNIRHIRRELHRALREAGYDPEALDPWTFPSEDEFHRLLDDSGFEIREMRTVDYHAVLNGDEGLHLWLAVFGQSLLMSLTESERRTLVRRVTERLRDTCFDGTNWNLHYHRLRFLAVRP